MRRIEIGLGLAVLFLVIAAVPGLATPTVTTIQTFTGANGIGPAVAMIQGADGLLYGTALVGGANNRGDLFSVDT